MILAAVKPASKQLCSFQQFSGKDAEMADIIIGTQIINGEIRLKMQCDHIVDAVALESRFIAVNIA